MPAHQFRCPPLSEDSRNRPKYCGVVKIMLAASLLFSASRVLADDGDDESEPQSPPVLMINLSQMDTALGNLTTAFQSVGREDMVDRIDQALERAGKLEGLDRKRSMGMAMFMPTTLPPNPVGVLYVPVEDVESLIETLQLGPFTVHKLTDRENEYEIIGSRRTRHLVVRDGYAFVSSDEAFLDADIALLANLVPRLAANYDFSVTFRPRSIPPILLDVFLGYLEARTAGQLQQRDNESLSSYVARRANGLSMLQLLQYVLSDGEQLTLGFKADPETGGAEIELIVDATDDSEFAQYLDDLASRPSAFAKLFTSDEPMALSASWMLDKNGQETFQDQVKALAIALQKRLYPEDTGLEGERVSGASERMPTIHPSIERLISPLTATIDNGHIDVFAQFREADTRFVLIGGLRLVGGETFAAGLRDVLGKLRLSDSAPVIELDVDRHQDVVFHRLGGDAVREQDRRLYGDNSSIYLGSGRRTLWFAIGGPDALLELKSAMDTLANAEGDPPSRDPMVPFQIVLHADRWTQLPASEDGREQVRQELSREAFAADNDTLRFEIRPTDDGIVIRAKLDAGFVRLLALTLSRRYDESQL